MGLLAHLTVTAARDGGRSLSGHYRNATPDGKKTGGNGVVCAQRQLLRLQMTRRMGRRGIAEEVAMGVPYRHFGSGGGLV